MHNVVKNVDLRNSTNEAEGQMNGNSADVYESVSMKFPSYNLSSTTSYSFTPFLVFVHNIVHLSQSFPRVLWIPLKIPCKIYIAAI